MTISDHITEFHGLPVFNLPDPGAKDASKPLAKAAFRSPAGVAWRVAIEPYDSKETWPEAFARFLAATDTTTVSALVVGPWGESDDTSATVIDAIVEARDRLPALRAVFLGDIVYEENEISWIHQSDVTVLLKAFPDLEEIVVRGSEMLSFPPLTHKGLRALTVQTGGLDGEVVRGIAASDLPALESLELWLGVDNYGGNTTVDDLELVFTGVRLPRLRHLALCNSEIQDEIAVAVASAPVVARLTTLGLAMGTLGDEGAEALLAGQPLTHLERLDLHHNFLSATMRERLLAALEPAGVTVDADKRDAEEDNGWRYTAVAE
ncbi:STM4015 family protein [Nocardia sp. 2]|uniref:STM4015 family protein n=1 Tax=Nocardia acididurans TaxID=2802282 RepID=A0ABS1MDJ5_9NOCA|nr:STM4015 family protein [Nocardia acididurans]MBL1078637.1 STM4015 family protein [Nocardia acididurans]